MIEWLRDADSCPEIELAGRRIPIALRRMARAKRLTMRLAPDGSEVRITLPRWCASKDALAFVHARRVWLEGELAKIPERLPPEPGGTISYRGTTLTIDWQPKLPRKPRLQNAIVTLGGPRETLAKRLQRWLEHEARTLLRADLDHYCAQRELNAPELGLSGAQRRWGSCSTSGKLRINWRLVQAPDFVRRSVVAHEVAHLVHFDHSPAFHALLGELFEGDLAAADGWLKEHGRTLYATFG